jgi:hypothetical protein
MEENLEFSQETRRHLYGFRWESTNLLKRSTVVSKPKVWHGKEPLRRSILLIVALQLVSLVIATVVAFPWAVEEAIIPRNSVAVQRICPGLNLAGKLGSCREQELVGGRPCQHVRVMVHGKERLVSISGNNSEHPGSW